MDQSFLDVVGHYAWILQKGSPQQNGYVERLNRTCEEEVPCAYLFESKAQWQCSKCDFRTTLRSGSIIEGSIVNFHT